MSTNDLAFCGHGAYICKLCAEARAGDVAIIDAARRWHHFNSQGSFEEWTQAERDLHDAIEAAPAPRDGDPKTSLVERTREHMRRLGIPAGTDNPTLLAMGAPPLHLLDEDDP